MDRERETLWEHETTVIMTGEEIKAATPSKEKGEEVLSLSELGSSPL